MSPEYKAAAGELRKDAAKWDTAAGVMSTAKQVVDSEKGLTEAFGFLGEGEGTPAAYEQVNTVLSTLAGQGDKELQYGGECLRTVAKVYEGAEVESSKEIKKAWFLP